jgi:glycosyltransferase involved in cell wall biosynthesis
LTELSDDQPSPVGGLRIAIVNWRDPWHPDAGGAEQYAWEIATGLLRRGATVCYLTARAAGQAARERRDGIDIVRAGGRWTVYPRVLAWMLRRRGSFDAVIDCQNGIPFFTPWVLPARVPVLCVVHHVHDAQFGVHFPPLLAAIGRYLEGPVARWAYRKHECVAVSASTVDAMRRRLLWTGPVHVIPNGLAAEAFAVPQTTVPQTTGPGTTGPGTTGPGTTGPDTTGQPTLTWVGRLVAHKRAGRVLDIAERLGRSGITIDVVGRGPEAGLLAEQVAARGLEGTVWLRGYLPEEDKRAAVAASVLHLNTSQGEGWGLCVLEAAALGVPTVAYDVDGLRDAVRDGETGWLVAGSERIEDVTERALKELADPVRRAEVAGACRAWARQFDWDHSAAQMAALIAAAVARRGSPGAASPAGTS